MKRVVVAALLLLVLFCGCRETVSLSARRELGPAELEELARCLTEKGWVMYGTSSCSGCRAQRKALGEAFAHINYVECDPYEQGADPERCLGRDIRKTPTWILERDGEEIERLEMYQLVDDLAAAAGCLAGDPGRSNEGSGP